MVDASLPRLLFILYINLLLLGDAPTGTPLYCVLLDVLLRRFIAMNIPVIITANIITNMIIPDPEEDGTRLDCDGVVVVVVDGIEFD